MKVSTLVPIFVLTIACHYPATNAAEILQSLDLRSKTTTIAHPLYFVVFVSRESPGIGPGHAFVLWGTEDNTAKVSIQEAWGFYPKDDSKGVFGDVPGEVRNEAYKKSKDKVVNYTARLVIQLTKDDYERSKFVRNRWKSEFQNYNLAKRNCVSFVKEVADSLGVATPSVSSLPDTPLEFMTKTIKLNGKAIKD